MLYSDYLKDKSHNAIKLNDVEGVPCILTHSKGKDLKNYEIYGNSYQDTRPQPAHQRNTGPADKRGTRENPHIYMYDCRR